jgi:di/tricarboxylate transporter
MHTLTLSWHGAFVIVLLVAALVLYSRPRVPIETTSLAVLLTLLLVFALWPYHGAHGELSPMVFYRGFANGALVAIVSLMIAGQALVRTGALAPLTRVLSRLWKLSSVFTLLLVLALTAALSAFVNDTPIVVLLIPVLTRMARDSGRSPSKMLMPLGFAALIGGMGTTIGTSTNLLVLEVAKQAGLPPMGMFAFTSLALIPAAIGLVYLWLIAPRLLPERDHAFEQASQRQFRAALELSEDSSAVGKPLAKAVEALGGMSVLAVVRGGVELLPSPTLELRGGDRLVVADRPELLKAAEKTLSAKLFIGEKPWEGDAAPLDDQQLAEIAILPASRFVGHSLRHAAFKARFNVTPLGIYRRGARLAARIMDQELLQPGDVVLVQGGKEAVEALRLTQQFAILDATTDLPRSGKANLALLWMVVIVLPAALHWLPIEITAPIGVLGMIASGCLKWDEIGGGVSPAVILLIASGFALSTALMRTHAGHFLAHAVVEATASLPPSVTLALVLFFVAVLGNAASHTTAALVGAPLAIQIAHGLHLSPEPFLLAVLFGANLGYATPMAYQTNVLVMNAAGYKFADFLRVGLPLLLIMGGLFTILLPRYFPF